MRKKLIALIGAGLLLAGCSSAPAAQEASGTKPTPKPTVTQTSMWDSMTFCEAFEEWRTDYQEALDTGESAQVSEQASIRKWSHPLREKEPTESSAAVEEFTAPIYMTESGTVDLIGLFNAGNDIAGDCIGN